MRMLRLSCYAVMLNSSTTWFHAEVEFNSVVSNMQVGTKHGKINNHLNQFSLEILESQNLVF